MVAKYVLFFKCTGYIIQENHIQGDTVKKIEILRFLTILDLEKMLITLKCVEKNPNIWKVNNIFVNNLRINGEIVKEIGKYFKLKDNKNIITQIYVM